MTMTSKLPHWTVCLFAVVASLCAVVILFGGGLTGALDPQTMDLHHRLSPPLADGYLLGSDEFGRDVAARLLSGLRWSVTISVLATLIAFTIGATLGIVAARRESWLSTALRQITTFTQAFPAFVLAVTVIAVVGDNGFWPVVLTLGLVTWPVFARVAYAESRVLFQREYVLAAEMIAAESGLGYRVFVVKRYVAMDVIIVYVLWATIIMFALDFFFQWLEKRYRWVGK